MNKDYQPYNPTEIESEIYSLWEQSGYFNPDKCLEKGITQTEAEPFSIVLPPPNVTGTLHTGHALMLAIEDAMVRFNRMRGRKTLWVPGTDHAAIATQAKVEKILWEEDKKTKDDLGREKFVRKVEKYASVSHNTIVNQVKRMGSSLDWTREAYTLDEQRSLAVREAFKRMYEAGLIYRGKRIVNWDPKLQTTVSDDEVVYIEEKTPLYYLKYGPFTIATARPETKFGDKYVVMHPQDGRYKDYRHGQKINASWINGEVEAIVIKDEIIDMSFGTGVMTITPWHDETDFQLSEKYQLDKEQIIDKQGKLMAVAGDFARMGILDARPKIIEKLREKGLLVKTETDYTHRIAVNSRGGGLIEPQILEQWFISVDKKFQIQKSKLHNLKQGDEVTLKELMQEVVKNGQIEILPGRFTKQYFHWVDNLKDWCISRQLWYGHRIPVYYCKQGSTNPKNSGANECGSAVVSVESLSQCPNCGGEVVQDPDTLDTWFSSGLWTFSTMGWPENTSELATYHPTSVLETGYDILFFWVARMILMSGFLIGEVPFKKVYLHGLIRDDKGRKMSKSLDNAIDPLELIEEFGADSLRMAMIYGTGVGNDQTLGEAKVRGMRNFVNKVYNIARFIRMNLAENLPPEPPQLAAEDKVILTESTKVVNSTTELFENCKLSDALQESYDFVWNTFASSYLEAVKARLKSEDASARAAQWTLVKVFSNQLSILHPFMPHVTERLYQDFKNDLPQWFGSELLMVSPWPKEL